MRFHNQIIFSTLPSTNSYLKENYQNLPNYSVVIAKHQTSGRGRMERKWLDGEDLLLSVLIKDALDVKRLSQMSLVTAAAVWKTLNKYLSVKIKWPNDILFQDKKISGILIESRIETNKLVLIIGIGININTKAYPEDLLKKASSLYLEKDKEFDINEIKDELLVNLNYYYQDFLDGKLEYLKVCRKHSALIGRMVIVDDFRVKKSARVIEILEDGSILLEIEGGTRAYSSGEISLQEYYN